MNLKNHSEKLVHFNFVAQYKSFRLAAKAANLSQPALSQSIQILEDSLNTTLFIRSRKGAQLSHEGKVLYNFTQQWFPALEHIEKSLLSSQASSSLSGLLRFSSYESLMPSYGIQLITQAKKLHPDLHINLMPQKSSYAITTMVLEHQADCGFLIEPENNAQLVNYPIYTEHYLFYANPEFTKSTIDKDLLNTIPLLYFPHALTGNRKLLQERLLDLNISPKDKDISTGGYPILLELAYQSHGIMLAPRNVIAHSPYAKKLLPLSVKGIPKNFGQYTLHLIFHKSKVQHPQHEMLLKFIQSVLK